MDTTSFDNNSGEHSRFELKALLDTSRLLIESHDIDFVLNNLLLITMGKLMISRGMILIYQPGDDTYIVSKTKGRTIFQENQQLSFEEGDALRRQSVIQSSEEGITPDILRQNDDEEITISNLRTRNNHIGLLVLGPKVTNRPLDRNEVEFVEALSIISSAAIANSRMFMELRSINRRLDRKVYELNTLFDLSKDFNMMVDREEIVRIFKFAMLGQMLIHKFFFILENQGEREMLTASGLKREPTPDEIDSLFNLENDLIEVDDKLGERIPFLGQHNIKAVIGLRFQNEKIALVGVGTRANQKSYSSSDFTFLRSLGNLALLSIQKTILLEERIEKERMEEELVIAKNIQNGLLPNPIPVHPLLDISARNIQSYQVGGDYFDILEMPSGNLLLAIGDVTGKGMPAALLMANLQAMLHVLLHVDISIGEATGRINEIIFNNTPADKFITFFWGIVNPEKKELRFVNAGHNPPILWKSGQDHPQKLEAGGLILGAMHTLNPYEEQTLTLSGNDLLVLYTDGVTEAMNANKTEEFGEQRLIDCIRQHRSKSADQIEKKIIQEVQQFSQNVQTDDITLLVIKINSKSLK